MISQQQHHHHHSMAPSMLAPRISSPSSQKRRLARTKIHNMAFADAINSAVRKARRSNSSASTLRNLADKIVKHVEIHGEAGIEAELANAIKVTRSLYKKIAWARKVNLSFKKFSSSLQGAPTPGSAKLALEKRVIKFPLWASEDESDDARDNSTRSPSPLAAKKDRNIRGFARGQRRNVIRAKIPRGFATPYNKNTFIFVFSSKEDPRHPLNYAQQPAHVHISYFQLISNSGFLRKVLAMKHDGTLEDPEDNLIYDPDVTIARKTRLNELAIYMHDLRDSEIAKLAPKYHQIEKLKSWNFWAGVKTFLNWVMHGTVNFGGKSGDKDGAFRVAAFLDVKMGYLDALKAAI